MLGKKYYIEFVGQHTSGKTRTIREIVDQGLLHPKKVIYPQKLDRSIWGFYLALPFIVIKQISHLWFLLRWLSKYTKWSWINYHSSIRHIWKMILLHPYYERFEFDIWMKDDMLHLLPRLNFQDGVDVENAFSIFFKHFSYLYDGLVYVDIPYEVMQDRFSQRFKNRDHKRKSNRQPVYERAFAQNQILKKLLQEQTIVPFLIISGTEDLQDNAHKVVSFIKEKVCK